MTTRRSRYVGVLLLVLGLSGAGCDHPLAEDPLLHNDIAFGINVLCRVDALNDGWALTMSMFDSIPTRPITHLYEGVVDVQGLRYNTSGGMPFTVANPLFMGNIERTLTVKLGLSNNTEFVATSPKSPPVFNYTFSTASQTSGMTITMPRSIEGGEHFVATVYATSSFGYTPAYRDTITDVGATTLVIPQDVVKAHMKNGTLRVGAQLVGLFSSDDFPGGALITFRHNEIFEDAEVVP